MAFKLLICYGTHVGLFLLQTRGISYSRSGSKKRKQNPSHVGEFHFPGSRLSILPKT